MLIGYSSHSWCLCHSLCYSVYPSAAKREATCRLPPPIGQKSRSCLMLWPSSAQRSASRVSRTQHSTRPRWSSYGPFWRITIKQKAFCRCPRPARWKTRPRGLACAWVPGKLSGQWAWAAWVRYLKPSAPTAASRAAPPSSYLSAAWTVQPCCNVLRKSARHWLA